MQKEEVQLGSDRWRARCGLRQVHAYIYIYTIQLRTLKPE